MLLQTRGSFGSTGSSILYRMVQITTSSNACFIFIPKDYQDDPLKETKTSILSLLLYP